MTSIANNSGEFSLGSNGESTGWFDLDSTIDDFGFNITGTFVATIALQVSNQNDYVKTRFSSVTSYTAIQSPLNVPRELGRYARFIVTAYTSGIAYIGLSKGRDTDGRLVDIRPQAQSNNPTGNITS